MRLSVILSAMLVIGGPAVSFAKPLTCPITTPAITGAVPASDIARLAAASNPVDRASILGRIVATMRGRGITPAGIVDSLISAYCPLIATSTLSDQQKTTNVRSLAGQAVRAAYNFDDATEIILDIALVPNIAGVVNERANRDKVTPQDWAAAAVTSAANAPR